MSSPTAALPQRMRKMNKADVFDAEQTKRRIATFLNRAARTRDEIYRAMVGLTSDYTLLEPGEDDEKIAQVNAVAAALTELCQVGVLQERLSSDTDERYDLYGPPGGNW